MELDLDDSRAASSSTCKLFSGIAIQNFIPHLQCVVQVLLLLLFSWVQHFCLTDDDLRSPDLPPLFEHFLVFPVSLHSIKKVDCFGMELILPKLLVHNAIQ